MSHGKPKKSTDHEDCILEKYFDVKDKKPSKDDKDGAKNEYIV